MARQRGGDRAKDRPSLWRFAIPVLAPSLLFAIGEGALLPVIPITAESMVGDLSLAGFISGLLMIGQVIGDVPGGRLVAALGERTGMALGGTAAAIASIGCFLAPNALVLSLCVLVIGMAAAVFALARHALLTQTVPVAYRARAMSLLGGTFRAGYFLGPLLSTPIIAWLGERWVYAVAAGFCLIVLLALRVLPDPARNAPAAPTAPTSPQPRHRTQGAGRTLRTHWSLLVRLGTGAGIIQLLRGSRQVILPIWGIHLQLDPAQIAIVVAVAGAVDVALFYTSGQVMDRWGRLWAAIPVLVGLSIGHLLLVFTQGFTSLMVVGVVLSVANGLGSGIVMTLGADVAPQRGMAEFLGAWRLFGDTGSAGGPLLVSGATSLLGLPVAAATITVVGLAGAWMMWRYIPRYIPQSIPRRAERT